MLITLGDFFRIVTVQNHEQLRSKPMKIRLRRRA